MIPMIDLPAAVQELRPEIDAAIARVLDGGRYVLGEEVDAFEREFAAFCGTAHCVAVGSGLDALWLALRAWSIGPGDEVIVPAYTAIATWMAVSLAGARPVGVDVDPRTRCLDPDRIADAITGDTRAIVPVHLFGRPAPIDSVTELAQTHGLRVLEDCAQAHGATVDDRHVGSIGGAGAFSFYPTKNLGALGDGGAIITDDDDLADRVRLLRSYGWRARDDSLIKGQNSRLDELQAALLRVKLPALEAWNGRRASVAAEYLEALDAVPGLELPDAGAGSVWHQFVVRHPSRDELRAALSEAGVATQVHYAPPPHLATTYRADGWRPGHFPVAEELSRTVLSLPVHPQLGEGTAREVAQRVGAAAAAVS
jgi:dTDP-3-amino-3,4,6-trideoxy-alpha-D-glucose transaminase